MWLVVEFVDDNEVAVIPSNWIDGVEAWGPPYRSTTRMMNAVKQKELPGTSWTSFRIKELYSSGKTCF